MSNPSRAKGTAYENELLEELRGIYGPLVDRAKAGNESNDFTGTPFPFEAKKRKVWDIRGWVRKIMAVAPDVPGNRHSGHRWVVLVAEGDRRRKDAVPDLMIVSRQFGMELLQRWG